MINQNLQPADIEAGSVRDLSDRELDFVAGGDSTDSGIPPSTDAPRGVRVDRAYRK